MAEPQPRAPASDRCTRGRRICHQHASAHERGGEIPARPRRRRSSSISSRDVSRWSSARSTMSRRRPVASQRDHKAFRAVEWLANPFEDTARSLSPMSGGIPGAVRLDATMSAFHTPSAVSTPPPIARWI